MADAEATAPKQQIGTPFKPGQSGNPKGRPKGSRNQLGEDFLKALHDDFKAKDDGVNVNGVQAIKAARVEKPVEYIRAIAGLLPKEMNLNVSAAEEMEDAELTNAIRDLESAIVAALGGAVPAEAGAATTDQHAQASVLPPLH